MYTKEGATSRQNEPWGFFMPQGSVAEIKDVLIRLYNIDLDQALNEIVAECKSGFLTTEVLQMVISKATTLCAGLIVSPLQPHVITPIRRIDVTEAEKQCDTPLDVHAVMPVKGWLDDDTHIDKFLVTETLISICLTLDERYRSFEKFAKTAFVDNTNNEDAAPNPSNLTQLYHKHFSRSSFCRMVGGAIKKDGYSNPPCFMSALLYQLIYFTKKNPLSIVPEEEGDTTDTSEHNAKKRNPTPYAMYKTLFIKKSPNAKTNRLLTPIIDARKEVNEDTEYFMQTLETYCSCYMESKLFDMDALVLLARLLPLLPSEERMKIGEKTIRFPITADAMAPFLHYLYFVPNAFGKESYVDYLVGTLEGKYTLQPSFSYINQTDKTILEDSKSVKRTDEIGEMEEAKERLKSCRQYLQFLATQYFPVLKYCFYALLMSLVDLEAERRKACGSSKSDQRKTLEDARKLLFEFIADQEEITDETGDLVKSKVESYFSGRHNWYLEALSLLTLEERNVFNRLVELIREEIANIEKWFKRTNPDFTLEGGRMRAHILDCVMRKRFGCDSAEEQPIPQVFQQMIYEDSDS